MQKSDTTNITAVFYSLGMQKPNEYAYYLIVEKGADVSIGKGLSDNDRKMAESNGEDVNRKIYPVDLLRNWEPEINTEEYRIKEEIIREFARQGIQY